MLIIYKVNLFYESYCLAINLFLENFAMIRIRNYYKNEGHRNVSEKLSSVLM